jgi:predicted PurR-regulated permease PerM
MLSSILAANDQIMNYILQSTNRFLLSLVLVTIVLYFGQPILIPIFLGALFAMLMAPLCRHLDKKMNRGLSSFVCVTIVMLSLLIIVGIGAWQIASFLEDVPALKERGGKLLSAIEIFIEESFAISHEKQESILQKQLSSLGQLATSYVGMLLGSLTSTVARLVLSLLFTFLFLYTKERYELFFVKVFKKQEPSAVKSVVGKISKVAEQYLLGRTISIVILFACYAAALLIIGIKNALLLAAVASLLTIIPYAGTIVGSIFPVLMALVTEDSFQPVVWTAIVMVGIQALDNYFIEPSVIGGEVNLSALATIVSIVCGGFIWGIAGTILFIPLLAIVKIVCDHVESLKPFGFIIGDPDGNKPSKMKVWFKQSKIHRN